MSVCVCTFGDSFNSAQHIHFGKVFSSSIVGLVGLFVCLVGWLFVVVVAVALSFTMNSQSSVNVA